MDCVAGVKQKLFASRVPQPSSSLQIPWQSGPPQNAMLLVADRQLVFGVSIQTPLPENTVHGPVQIFPATVLQTVATTVKALRGERVPNGSPMIVMSAGC